MKKLIILPGNSSRNQVWGEAVAEHYGDWFSEVYLQYYEHWQTGAANINLSLEIDKLKEVIAKDDIEVEYIVMAKSIGSILALLAIDKKVINPSKCIFFGMPFDFALANTFKDNLKPLSSFITPAIAFHNMYDPTANYETTKITLEKYMPEVKLVTLMGDNHNYDEFNDRQTVIKEFLNL